MLRCRDTMLDSDYSLLKYFVMLMFHRRCRCSVWFFSLFIPLFGINFRRMPFGWFYDGLMALPKCSTACFLQLMTHTHKQNSLMKMITHLGTWQRTKKNRWRIRTSDKRRRQLCNRKIINCGDKLGQHFIYQPRFCVIHRNTSFTTEEKRRENVKSPNNSTMPGLNGQKFTNYV